ncbi:hypothetical protein [Streptomyces sp. NPDC005009]
MAKKAAELAAGTLDPDCACMVDLFPEELLLSTDAALDVFEAELLTLAEGDDARVFAGVRAGNGDGDVGYLSVGRTLPPFRTIRSDGFPGHGL